MSNRNFDNRVIIQRLQNQVYSRNLYINNTSGNKIINNSQNSDGNASRFNSYIPGAQTEYSRGLIGAGETVSIGGIVNIPPFPLPEIIFFIPPTIPSAPTIADLIGNNQSLVILFTAPTNDGGSTITDYQYSFDGTTWSSANTTSSPIIITGLTNGTEYDVQLRAVNSVGPGASSSAILGTPNIIQTQSFNTPLDSPIMWIAPLNIYVVEYLVVGGGGGGGNGFDTGGGGGGGGGMVLTGTLIITPESTYSVTVGNGGTGGANTRVNNDGTDGNSSIFHTITALGGGFGKGSRTQTTDSGFGGAGAINPSTATIGGSGGGNIGTAVGGSGGGGGGAGGDGTSGIGSANNPGSGGIGGAGITSLISGLSVIYGEGGAGARGNTNVAGVNGLINRGNGGSAGSNVSFASNAGGNGGSGIVILRY
jgi:hypothetical protein